jgi:putative tricarboxylic transport membrane protein
MTRTVTASIFLVYSLAFVLIGLQYPMLTDDGQFGPGFFPRVTGVVLVGLCAWNLVRERGVESPKAERPDLRDAAVILALIVGYVFGMYLVGTTIPTFAFALLLLLRFNRGHLVANLVFSTVLTASIPLAFGEWFNTSIPEGLFTVVGLP